MRSAARFRLDAFLAAPVCVQRRETGMDEYENSVLPPDKTGGLSAKQSFSRVGWTFFTMLGSANLVQLLLLKLGARYAPQLVSSDWATWFLSLLPLYLIALPLGWLILRRLPASAPAENPLSAGHLMMFFVMCIAVMYLGNLIGVALNMGIAEARGSSYDNPIEDLLSGTNVWASLVSVVLIAPVMEEFIFRKLLCDRIRAYGERTAVLVSGLVFGLFHGNLYQFFYAFGIGAVFAYIYLRTGRVRYTMLLHAGINFLGGVLPEIVFSQVNLEEVSELASAAPEKLLSYLHAHLAGMLALGVYGITMLALFILGIVFLLMRRKEALLLPAEKQLPKRGRVGVIFGNAGMIVYMLLSAALMTIMVIMA